MASSRVLPGSFNTHTYGVGRDYGVGQMATWESDHTIDLSIADKGEVLDCYDDAASFDESGITIAGATNITSTRFRVIRAPSGQRHDGTPNNGFTISSTGNAVVVTISEAYCELQDLIVNGDFNSANNRDTLTISATGTNAKIVGCLVKGINSGSAEGRGISQNGVNSLIINCLIYECKTRAYSSWITTGNSLYVYNCTAINNANGFTISGQLGATAVLTNCISQDHGGGDFLKNANVTATLSYCLSKDATADDWGGAGNIISTDLTFANEAGDDWHLAAADAAAIGAGTDLSGIFDDDIDFTVRNSWDIGFDEYVAAGGPITIADSGIGSDSLSAPTVSIPTISDSGTGADAPTPPSVSLPAMADAGTGSDILSAIQALISLSDSGSGADIMSQLQAALSIIETASGMDSAAAFILISVSETAVGSDVVSNVLATIAVSESGAGSDVLPSILISFTLSDSGTASDAITVSGGGFITILEAAFGADSISPALANATVVDAGSGVDETSILVMLPNISDTGVGADLIAEVIKALFVSITDAGAGVDLISGISVLVPVGDSGTGVDLIGAITAVLSVLDVAQGTDVAVNLTLLGSYRKLEVKFSGKKGGVSFSGKKGRVKFTGKKGRTDFNA